MNSEITEQPFPNEKFIISIQQGWNLVIADMETREGAGYPEDSVTLHYYTTANPPALYWLVIDD